MEIDGSESSTWSEVQILTELFNVCHLYFLISHQGQTNFSMDVLLRFYTSNLSFGFD